MSTNLIVGTVCLVLGCLTLAARLFKWDGLLSKRVPMQARFGAKVGDFVHFAAYTMLPILAGVVFLTTD
ncbi:MAG: hypothetical protein AAFZ01_05845 [Pseudomonadota bacterium]